MSNEFDDLDLEIDLTTSGEIDEGFELKHSPQISFIEDDVLGSDDVVIMLTAGGTFEPEAADLEAMLLLEEGDIDLGLELGDVDLGLPKADTPKYEVSLSPAQTAVALYKPQQEESFLVETSNREIHNALHDIGQYERESNIRLRTYLESTIFDMLPKGVRFKSHEFSKQQDFRSMLISDFLNHRSIPNEYTEDHIINKVFVAYEAERLPELSEQEVKDLTRLIHNFVLFANSTFDEAERLTQLAEYKEFPKTLICPEVVGNFVYVCKCGTEYEMPQGRPTLTFLIRELSKTPVVTLMNQQIPCEKCQVYLALPTPLVEVLNVEMQDYVKQIKASYEQPRIYRPKLADLTQMIPSNVKELFQLESGRTVDVVAPSSATYNGAFTSYSKLIGMWMNAVTSKHKLDEVTESFKESPEVLKIAEQLTLVDFGFVADLYSYQFAKTVVHYLEGFSLFSLTREKQAYYEYCDIEGYSKHSFPASYAKEWIYNNAPYIASLNNIYSGDTKMAELNILPEYLDAINYVVGLHLLAKPELLDNTSDLAKWIKKPTASLKTIEKIYKKLNPSDKEKLALSHRDLVNTSIVHEQSAWSDTYTFLKTIVAPNRYNPGVAPEIKALATKAVRQPSEQFYGQAIPEKIVVKPTLMFEEFMIAFKDFGYLLFTGAIIDEVRKNLAKGIELFRKADLLHTVFKSHDQSVTDISNILISESKEAVDQKRLLFELVMRVGDLPGELNDKREEIGYKDILANFDEYSDELTSDAEFMRKYGEAVECYL